jgi:hypothetical protein
MPIAYQRKKRGLPVRVGLFIQTLGVKNVFKKEGLAICISPFIQTLGVKNVLI